MKPLYNCIRDLFKINFLKFNQRNIFYKHLIVLVSKIVTKHIVQHQNIKKNSGLSYLVFKKKITTNMSGVITITIN